jgi:hypothetical protein
MNPLIILTLVALTIVVIYATFKPSFIDAPLDSNTGVPFESQRKSINYYAWKGPFFIEGFNNFHRENNPLEELVPGTESADGCTIPKYNTNNPDVLECHQSATENCLIPTLTSEDSWRNEYHNSQYRLGKADAFKQATNNNLSAPNNLKSAQMKSIMGDWFDPKDKVSPWCYAESLKTCMNIG